MKIGIVGLPNVGKSTIFNALTSAGAGAENYPFCTIDPNIGVVKVPDERLDVLDELYNPKLKTPTTINFVDIAGLVEGASRGEGLGNKFLSHIREVDAVAQVVRCFTDENVTHVDGDIDPVRDIDIINMELILADLSIVENRIEKCSKKVKSGEKEVLEELKILKKMKNILEEGKSIRQIDIKKEEKNLAKQMQLITAKPVIYITNIDEKDLTGEDNSLVKSVKKKVNDEGAAVIKISAKIEADLAELDEQEAKSFLEEMGLSESGLDRVIKSSYALLDLITFFTAGEKEVRAWTVNRGSTAPEAAGKIHSDMQKGFIRAEVIAFNDLVDVGSIAAARDKGFLRLEGKEYIIKDGDVCYFRFNV